MNKINKTNSWILLIVFIQVFVLINSTTANAQSIGETAGKRGENLMANNTKDIFSLLTKGLNFLIGFFSIKQIGIVSASDLVCCEKTKDGNWCLEKEPSECKTVSEGYDQTGEMCSLAEFCDPGICFDSTSGICASGVPEQECIESQGQGAWTTDLSDGRCQKGCCYLDSNTRYMEEKRCKILSDYLGLVFNFDKTKEEGDCIFLSEDKGACVKEGVPCEITTEKDCADNHLGGAFNKGLYCSDPILSEITGCTHIEGKKGCLPRENDVYYVDSCGEPEGIAQECTWGISTCGLVNGGYGCKDTKCTEIDKDGNKKTRKNGESWCDYDSYVGEIRVGEMSIVRGYMFGQHITKIYNRAGIISANVPGSSHFLKACDDGEITTTLCDPYRTRICSEKVEDGIFHAECRQNLQRLCFFWENQDECDSFPDCRWQDVDLTGIDERDNFKFGVCVPKYPTGFNNGALDGYQNGKDVCGLLGDKGKVTCTYVEQKEWHGVFDTRWNCKVNCRCRDQAFVEQLNDLCMALGDCGVNINLAGKISGNLPLSGSFDRPTETEWYNRYKKILQKSLNVIGVNTPLPFISDKTSSGEGGGTNINVLTPENPGRWGVFFGLNGGSMNAFEIFWIGIGLISEGPIGALLVALTFLVFKAIFGIGKTRQKTTTFECMPWRPPYGGADCDKCNDEPEKCNEYRCKSFGTLCQLEDRVYDGENKLCYPMFSDDSTSPSLTFKSVKPGTFSIDDSSGQKIVTIKKSNSEECYTKNTDKVNITINTSELAECRWDRGDWPVFNEMQSYTLFREGTKLSTTHHIDNLPIVANVPAHKESFAIYVRCIDNAGNFEEKSMKITACVNPEPDSFPPVIESFAPPSGSYMQFSATSFSFTAYLDEPGQCKFDYERLIPYEDMSDENAMLCNLEDDESLEYFCGAILTNIASDQTDISVYIKCNDSSGNVNSNFDEAKYDIIRTPAPLNITSTYANTFLIPEEGIVIERTSVSEFFTLEATTEGGVDNGISLCRFKFAEVKWRNNFQKTNSREHKSVFNSLPSGTHTIQILCKDSIGNTAEKTITITSKIHDAKPIITRVYGRGNSITLATDEEARCYYSNKDCYFDITDRSESTQIIIYYDIKQEFGADDKQTYYIRCQDKYDKMSDCLSVKLSEL